MSYTYRFKQSYTKLGREYNPSSLPVCTVVDTSNNILANAQASTLLSNLTGIVLYEVVSATTIDPIAMFYTSDVTVDCQTLFDYTPSVLVNNLDVAVSTRSSHSASDVWGVTVRTLTSGGGVITAQDVWEYDRRTLTSLSIPPNYNSTLNGSYDSINQVPGKLDITMKKGDDLSFDCKFNFDMTGFTYGASITPMTTSGTTDIAIVVTPNDITTGDFHFFISKISIASLPILTNKHKWNFYWVDGSLKRTTLGGYLNLEGV